MLKTRGELKMKFQPKCLGYMNTNIQLAGGFEVKLACLHRISPRGEQEERESAVVVRCGGLRFRTILVFEVKHDARENRPGGVHRKACQGAGGGCLAKGPGGKRQAQGNQCEEVPMARQ